MNCEFCNSIIMPKYEEYILVETALYMGEKRRLLICCNTCYDRHIPPESIETRFEILDL